MTIEFDKGRGPFPCVECGADPTWALIALVESPYAMGVVSVWFCDEHSHKGWAVVVDADESGVEFVSMQEASEAPAEIESIENLLRESLDEALRAGSSGTDNRAARRSRAAGRHRQRRGSHVASPKRSKGQGPKSA